MDTSFLARRPGFYAPYNHPPLVGWMLLCSNQLADLGIRSGFLSGSGDDLGRCHQPARLPARALADSARRRWRD
jgi:hypothetical protein